MMSAQVMRACEDSTVGICQNEVVWKGKGAYFVCARPRGKSFVGSGGVMWVRCTSTVASLKTMFCTNGDGTHETIGSSPARGVYSRMYQAACIPMLSSIGQLDLSQSLPQRKNLGLFRPSQTGGGVRPDRT